MYDNSSSSSLSTTTSQNQRRHSKSLNVPQGHASFRLLCHESRVSKLIGPGGSVIKRLTQSTGAHRIWIKDATSESPDRVVVVIASSAIGTTFTDSNGVVVEVSKAQGALLRVFEKILEVSGAGDADVGKVSCRLLVDGVQVLGLRWGVVEKMKKDCGCLIKVWGDDNKLPVCADPGDHVVEIEGNVLAVKKALVAVSHHLQDYQPSDKPNTPSGEVPHQTFTDTAYSSTGYAKGVRPSPTGADRTPMLHREFHQQEVTFRILCSNDLAGGVLGRNGTIVKDLESQSGANIKVGPMVAECEERLITVSAVENPDITLPSPAQKALDLVLVRLLEAGNEKRLHTSSSKPTFTARLVILTKQAGCLLGKGGATVKDMKKLTGANIWIYQNVPVPKCALENDNIVEIKGEFSQVQNAVSRVACRLRDNIFSNGPNGAGMLDGTQRAAGPPGQGPIVNLLNCGQNITEMQNSNQVKTSSYGGLEKGSATVVRVTKIIELAVPEEGVSLICGEKDCNLEHLRQISGAKITLRETYRGMSHRIIEISGTPEESDSALNYLEEFIL